MNAICCGENEGETKAETRSGVCAQRQIRGGAVKRGVKFSEKCESKKENRHTFKWWDGGE